MVNILGCKSANKTTTKETSKLNIIKGASCPPGFDVWMWIIPENLKLWQWSSKQAWYHWVTTSKYWADVKTLSVASPSRCTHWMIGQNFLGEFLSVSWQRYDDIRSFWEDCKTYGACKSLSSAAVVKIKSFKSPGKPPLSVYVVCVQEKHKLLNNPICCK